MEDTAIQNLRGEYVFSSAEAIRGEFDEPPYPSLLNVFSHRYRRLF